MVCGAEPEVAGWVIVIVLCCIVLYMWAMMGHGGGEKTDGSLGMASVIAVCWSMIEFLFLAAPISPFGVMLLVCCCGFHLHSEGIDAGDDEGSAAARAVGAGQRAEDEVSCCKCYWPRHTGTSIGPRKPGSYSIGPSVERQFVVCLLLGV